MNIEDLNIRPSSIPTFIKCPSSSLKTGFVQTEAGVPANVGSAIHKLFELYTSQGLDFDRNILREIADEYKVELDGYMGLSRKANNLKQKYDEHAAKYFPAPEREKYMSYPLANGFVLKGTADLVQIHDDFAVVLDLKTGESEMMDNMPQIKAYALMLWRMCQHLGVEEIYGFVFNPVLEKYYIDIWTAKDLMQYEQEIVDLMDQVGTVYNAGSHCTYCPRLVECPLHLRSAHALLKDDKVIQLDDCNIGKIRPMVQHLKQICKDYDDFETARLKQNGNIDLGDGTELYHKESHRSTYDTAQTLQLIRDFRDDTVEVQDAILDNLTIGTSVIKKIIASTAEKGMKLKDSKEILERLEEAGAVEKTVVLKKTVRQKPKEIEYEQETSD